MISSVRSEEDLTTAGANSIFSKNKLQLTFCVCSFLRFVFFPFRVGSHTSIGRGKIVGGKGGVDNFTCVCLLDQIGRAHV